MPLDVVEVSWSHLLERDGAHRGDEQGVKAVAGCVGASLWLLTTPLAVIVAATAFTNPRLKMEREKVQWETNALKHKIIYT